MHSDSAFGDLGLGGAGALARGNFLIDTMPHDVKEDIKIQKEDIPLANLQNLDSGKADTLNDENTSSVQRYCHALKIWF